MMRLGIALFCIVIVCGSLAQLGRNFGGLVAAVAVFGIGLLVASGYNALRIKNTPVLCTKCRKAMVYKEIDHPGDSETLAGYARSFLGEAGRVYVGVDYGGPWYRLLRGVHSCEDCRRYFISREEYLSKQMMVSPEEAEQSAADFAQLRSRIQEGRVAPNIAMEPTMVRGTDAAEESKGIESGTE